MFLKRSLDITFALLALIVLSPFMVAIAVAVWLDSGSPILFRQKRVGLNFEPFEILKFRTMRFVNSGPLVTARGDTRITPVGRFLRLTKLDEIPQFWNVLRGDMSLVGPRPEVPKYVELFRPRYQSVLSVRPGITDLGSIHFRNEEDLLVQSVDPLQEYEERVLPTKLLLAEKYVRNHSFIGDLTILIRTAVATLRFK